ncbi:MAG TPA: YciI family protein [Acidimicrobiales bacterium]
MRFFGYTLASETDMPSAPPRPELYEEMGKFVQEAIAAGVIVATGGIAPTSEGVKISLNDGKFTVVDGPFAEAKELVGGWALMECRDLDEAVEWSKRFVSVLGEGEVRVRPVSGAE